MVEATVAQGHQQDTPVTPGSADDWLGCDYDVETSVYLLVQPSPATGFRDAQWCIAWPVGGLTERRMTAWRHIQVDACMALVDQDEPPQYAYFGPLTTTTTPSSAKLIRLMNTTLAMRKKIEHLAQGNGALSSDSGYNVAWVKKLLDSMVASGLMPASKRDQVVHQASAF